MRISNEALIATIRGAVADQRAATLAFDADRLAAANSRLDQALSTAQDSMGSAPALAIDPALIRQARREMSANGELLHAASAANQRALSSVMPAAISAPVYTADGANKVSGAGRPIAQA